MARIMIVDDEPTTLELYSQAVSLLGHDTVTALSGTKALEEIESEPPDLILLDLMMPGIDGYETLRRLRSMPTAESLPVIVVTASAEQDVDERVELAGGDACLRKPVDMTTLFDHIHIYLDNR